jgi:hypothetical protein
MESIGAGYGAGKSAVCETIQWVEDTLAKDKTFRLPDKKALKRKALSIEYIVADVTENPVNRPKNQKEWYSGKKKRHTVKTRVIIEQKTMKIIDLQEGKGGGHNFKIYKDTIGKSAHRSIRIDANLGYLGIANSHTNSRTPKKAGKKHGFCQKSVFFGRLGANLWLANIQPGY